MWFLVPNDYFVYKLSYTYFCSFSFLFCREQPIFTCKAHVFHIDPKTKRSWLAASSSAVNVSFFYDSSRALYRIISVEGTKVSSFLSALKSRFRFIDWIADGKRARERLFERVVYFLAVFITLWSVKINTLMKGKPWSLGARPVWDWIHDSSVFNSKFVWGWSLASMW